MKKVGSIWFALALCGCQSSETLTAGSRYESVSSAASIDIPLCVVPASPADRSASVVGPIPSAAPGDASHNYPWSATDMDLAALGYVEEEYFFCGQTAAGPYTTRMIVRRPVSAAAFSGVVTVDWLNVTLGYDLEPLWLLSRDEIIRKGHAYVGVSAQRAGVYTTPNGLKPWSPQRYAQLDIPLQDRLFLFIFDPVAYEIFDQALTQIKTPKATAPLGPLRADTLIVAGASQSAGTLMAYYDQYQAVSSTADGFLAFLLSVSSLEAALELPSETYVEFAVPSDAVRTPYFLVNTESDPTYVRQPDTDTFRLWEVAGASHLDEDGIQRLKPVYQRDTATDITAGDSACTYTPRSRIPFRYALNAALAHLIEWVHTGKTPPVAPRFEYDNQGLVVRDDYGNIRGGLRLSQHEVATAVNRRENPGCSLEGQYQPFDAATLLTLYPSHIEYMRRVGEATAANLAAGFILEPDAEQTMKDANAAAIPLTQ